ncbi:MAG: ATP-grasp domain-containing protein [Candidatus Nanoarchaeia archaeon]
MKRGITIGYIFWNKKETEDEKAFRKIAKQKNVNLIFFNLNYETDDKKIIKKAKECDIIFNNSAEDYAVEIVKTFESLGIKVIDSSKTYYYSEDKWMFYLKCLKHNIPTPKTLLLSENIPLAQKELKKIKTWPIILKKIEGCQGNFVKKASDLNEARLVLKKFWNSNQRTPVIAQEYIPSKSYRVTTINKKTVQTALKESNGWKATGVYQKKHKKFTIDKKLKSIINKVNNAFNISVCGIDFIKKGKKWLVLEVNANPALDFFPKEREGLVEKIIDLLISKLNKKNLNNYPQ